MPQRPRGQCLCSLKGSRQVQPSRPDERTVLIWGTSMVESVCCPDKDQPYSQAVGKLPGLSHLLSLVCL